MAAGNIPYKSTFIIATDLCIIHLLFVSYSIHPSLSLLATSSGQWKPQVDDDDDKIIFENSLKIWSLNNKKILSKTN